MQVIFFTLLRDLHPLVYVRAGRTKKEDNLNGYPPLIISYERGPYSVLRSLFLVNFSFIASTHSLTAISNVCAFFSITWEPPGT